MSKRRKKIPTLDIGYDTEYESNPKYGSPYYEDQEKNPYSISPVSSQIAVKGFKFDSRMFDLPKFHTYKIEGDYLALMFDTRGLILGEPYREWFSEMMNQFLDILGLDTVSVQMYTHYSSAELKHHIPVREHLRKLKLDQGETDKFNPSTNINLTSIQGTFNLKNYGLRRKAGCDDKHPVYDRKIEFRDSRQYYAKTSLSGIAVIAQDEFPGIDIKKHPSTDWDKETASQWWKRSPDEFCEYAMRDAIIVLAVMVKTRGLKNEALASLEKAGIVPKQKEDKLVKKAYEKDYLTAASQSCDFAVLTLRKQGVWGSFQWLCDYLNENLPSIALQRFSVE